MAQIKKVIADLLEKPTILSKPIKFINHPKIHILEEYAKKSCGRF